MATLLNEEDKEKEKDKDKEKEAQQSPIEGYKGDSDSDSDSGSDSDSDSDSDEEHDKKSRKKRRSRKKSKKRRKKDREEGFELLEDAYVETIKPVINGNADEFKKKHCKNGHLMSKDHRVKTEMAEHVFPEIKYNAERCNLCDPTCDYSIIESKIETEQVLRPKESNDWVDHVWKTMSDIYSNVSM